MPILSPGAKCHDPAVFRHSLRHRSSLIGSSVLRRLRAQPELVGKLIVADRDPVVLERIRCLDLGDVITDDMQKAVEDADCVMLCVPVGAIAPVAALILPHMKPGAILTDVGSTRRSVVDALTPLLRSDIAYVPAHPMAGTEHSGPDAALPRFSKIAGAC